MKLNPTLNWRSRRSYPVVSMLLCLTQPKQWAYLEEVVKYHFEARISISIEIPYRRINIKHLNGCQNYGFVCLLRWFLDLNKDLAVTNNRSCTVLCATSCVLGLLVCSDYLLMNIPRVCKCQQRHVQQESWAIAKMTAQCVLYNECPENLRESVTMPTAASPQIFNGLFFILTFDAMNMRTKFEARNFTSSWDNRGTPKIGQSRSLSPKFWRVFVRMDPVNVPVTPQRKNI